MSRPRKHIPLGEKLAAMTYMWRKAVDELSLGSDQPRTLPREDVLQMTAAQVNSLVVWDHYPIRHEAGGSDKHHNLTPRFIREHRRKTSNDVKEMAKAKRLRMKIGMRVINPDGSHEIVTAIAPKPKPKRKWPSRPFPTRPKLGGLPNEPRRGGSRTAGN